MSLEEMPAIACRKSCLKLVVGNSVLEVRGFMYHQCPASLVHAIAGSDGKSKCYMHNARLKNSV